MDKLGIVFSGRVRSALLGFLALWILLALATTFFQVMGAYFGGGGFDVTVHDYIWIDVIVIFPYFLGAAVVLRSLTARIALFHKLRRQIVVPEYNPPDVLTPAEAGMLVDNDFSFNEIAGTLKDLELRGRIYVIKQHGEFEIRPASMHGLNEAETVFVQELLGPGGVYRTNSADSRSTLLAAGKHMAALVREQLVLGGQLPAKPHTNRIIRAVVALLVGIAVLVQLFLTWSTITAGNEIFSIGYPRYPMSPIEPILEVAMAAVVLVIACSGFWRRSLADDSGLRNWRYVAGLKMFIEKVYKDRFYRDGKQMASDGDLRTFYPYAIALGIEKRFAEQLKRALAF